MPRKQSSKPARRRLLQFYKSIFAGSLLWLLCTSLAFAAETSSPDATFLSPHGPVAAAQRQHFIDIILLMLIVLLPVLIGMPFVAWRYRFRNKSTRYTPGWGFYWPLEVVIWGVPLAVVAVLSIWLVHGTTTLDPYRALKSTGKPLEVDVIGYDWKWLFVYPQLHIASIGQLVIPEHRQISMRLTSDTVMQSFFIPALGSQIYAMAAMQTRLHLMADSTGQFLGENTQYNGLGFQHQRFIARATTLQGFRDWVAIVNTNGVPLTPPVYDAIARHTTVSQLRSALNTSRMPPNAVFFNHVNPDLLRNVVSSFHGGPSSSSAIVDNHPGQSGMHNGSNLASLATHQNVHHNAG